jgi:uncharacterized integral membrane protein
MKNIKFILWFIIIGFVVMFIFQNQDIIRANQSFRINLFFFDEYRTPEFPNALLFLVCFVIGYIIAYLLGIAERFKSSKTIRSLKTETASQLEEISALKKDLESFQSDPSVSQENSTEREDSDAYNPTV